MISIIGSGGHAISLINNFFKYKDINIIYDVFTPKKNEKIHGIKIKKFDIKKINKKEKLFIAIGDNVLRKNIYYSLKKNNFTIDNCISEKANLIKPIVIEKGNYIFSDVYIGPKSKIGENNIINTGSIIEHETEIGNNCNINPGVIICGKVKIGNNVVVGAGSILLENTEICSNVIIGAGSLITKSIKRIGLYYGSPAKFIKDAK
jgi:UDP-perosamine 4-acetyltransferase